MAPGSRPSCLLHVGMHKTGSSAIQLALSRSFDGYVDLGRGPNHSGALHAAFAENPGAYHFFRRLGLDDQELAGIRQQVLERLATALADGRQRYVLSGEDMCSLDDSELERLKAFILGYVDTVDVVAYVRSPASFMGSAFQQRIRGGYSSFNLMALYPQYRKRLQRFDRVFGRARTRLMPFSPRRFIGGDVVSDFSERMELGLEPDTARAHVNVGLSGPATALLYVYRKFGSPRGEGREDIRINRALVWALGQLPGDKFQLRLAALEGVLARFRADIDWVEGRMGKSFEAEIEHPGFGVAAEPDLIRVYEAQLAWLRDLDPNLPVDMASGPDEVARAVHSVVPLVLERYAHARKLERLAG